MNLAEWSTIVFLPLAVMSDCSQLKSEFYPTQSHPVVVQTQAHRTATPVIQHQDDAIDNVVEFFMLILMIYGVYALPRDVFRKLTGGHS